MISPCLAAVKEKSNPFGRRGTQYARCNVTTLHFFQGNDYCHGAVLSFENYQILTSHWSLLCKMKKVNLIQPKSDEYHAA